MPARLKRLTIGMLLLCAFSAAAACEWPAWQQYKQFYISEQGRVIDPSSPNRITTSEGQSYGLFFALVANDRPAFDQLLTWTENNLAAGDLSAHLPAWLWGENEQKQWTVLDSNSASDADLWIAYNLLEAGRLWKSRRYQTLGTLLLQRIAREEVADIPGLGLMLLPGKVGFVAEDRWRLNPSKPTSGCGWKPRRTAFRRTGWCGRSAKAGNRIPSNRISAVMTPSGFICGPACWRTTMNIRRRCSSNCNLWRS